MATEGMDTGADGPAALARDSKIVITGGKARGSVAAEATEAKRITCECTIDTLFAQHHLTRTQWQAGVKFRRLWLLSARRAAVTGRYGQQMPRATGDADGAAGRSSDARAQIDAAIREMGQIRSAAVIAVAGEDEGARGRLKPLAEGLDVLADWWGLTPARAA